MFFVSIMQQFFAPRQLRIGVGHRAGKGAEGDLRFPVKPLVSFDRVAAKHVHSRRAESSRYIPHGAFDKRLNSFLIA